MSKEALQADSNRFIENIKYYIDRYGIENVYNTSVNKSPVWHIESATNTKST